MNSYLRLKRLIILFSILITYSGCRNVADTSKIDKLEYIEKENLLFYSDSNKIDSTFDFLSACPNLNLWIGGIMGIPKSDSTGLYYFGECLNVPQTYRLIWVPKGSFEYRKSISFDILKEKFATGKSSSYGDFNIYAFLLPLKDIEQFDDPEMEIIEYPAKVSVYEFANSKWELIRIDTINSLSEFGKLQLGIIFN